MRNFNTKGEIISTNVIHFKNRLFILDESLTGIDSALVGTFKDGTVEILYFDFENPSFIYSSKEYLKFVDPKFDFDRILQKYEDVYENGSETLIRSMKRLGITI